MSERDYSDYADDDGCLERECLNINDEYVRGDKSGSCTPTCLKRKHSTLESTSRVCCNICAIIDKSSARDEPSELLPPMSSMYLNNNLNYDEYPKQLSGFVCTKIEYQQCEHVPKLSFHSYGGGRFLHSSLNPEDMISPKRKILGSQDNHSCCMNRQTPCIATNSRDNGHYQTDTRTVSSYTNESGRTKKYLYKLACKEMDLQISGTVYKSYGGERVFDSSSSSNSNHDVIITKEIFGDPIAKDRKIFTNKSYSECGNSNENIDERKMNIEASMDYGTQTISDSDVTDTHDSCVKDSKNESGKIEIFGMNSQSDSTEAGKHSDDSKAKLNPTSDDSIAINLPENSNSAENTDSGVDVDVSKDRVEKWLHDTKNWISDVVDDISKSDSSVADSSDL